jgi:hypothetical protein
LLKLDFSGPVSQGNLKVSLFDLTGRQVAVPFAGRISSPHLMIPLGRAEMRTGAYVIRVLLDNNILIQNRMIFN